MNRSIIHCETAKDHGNKFQSELVASSANDGINMCT